MLISGCSPPPTKPHQSRQAPFLPSLHKVCVAWDQVPVLQSDLVYVAQTHQWSPFYLLLGAYVGPDCGSANCALSPRLSLLSFSEGPESTGGSTPGLEGTSGNHQHPSLPPAPSPFPSPSCLSSFSLGNVNIQQHYLAGKSWKKT